jgi:hypothetical protein
LEKQSDPEAAAVAVYVTDQIAVVVCMHLKDEHAALVPSADPQRNQRQTSGQPLEQQRHLLHLLEADPKLLLHSTKAASEWYPAGSSCLIFEVVVQVLADWAVTVVVFVAAV